MPHQFRAQSIHPNNAARAYPLIQVMRSDVSLEGWLAFVAATNADSAPTPNITAPKWPSRGVLAIENARGYIHGLFSYHVAFAIDHEAVLEVSNFVAVDSADRAAGIKALIASMEELAHALGCTAIHTHVPGNWPQGKFPEAALSRHLRHAGHHLKSMNLYKPLR